MRYGILIFAKHVPAKHRRTYTLDGWTAALSGVYSGCIFAGPFYLMVATRLGASDMAISMMVAAPFFGNMVALFWANAMEGRPKMPFAVGSWIAGRAILLLMACTVAPFWYAAIIFLSQFIGTAASPAYAAIMKDVYPDEHRGRIMGYVRVLMAAVMIVTTLIVGKVLDLNIHSYRLIFPIGGIVGIAAAIVFSRIYTSPPSTHEIESKGNTLEFLMSSISILVEDRGFRWFALSVCTYGLGSLIVAPVYTIFMVRSLKISNFDAGLLSMITMICWMGAFVFWGRYVDARSPLRATVINVLLAVIVPLNFILAGYFHSIWVLLPQAVIAGITNAGIELSYFNSVLAFSGDRRVSHYQALFYCLLGIRGCLAPILGGVMLEVFNSRDWDLRYLFTGAAAIMIVGAWMQVIGMRRESTHSGHVQA